MPSSDIQALWDIFLARPLWLGLYDQDGQPKPMSNFSLMLTSLPRGADFDLASAHQIFRWTMSEVVGRVQ